MFLSVRPIPRSFSRAAILAGGSLLAVAPACAGSSGVPIHAEVILADAQRMATEWGAAVAAYWRPLMAGEMEAIQMATWLFSGLISLIALRLLIRRPYDLAEAAEPDVPVSSPGPSRAEPVEVEAAAEGDRPRRLLEAIAAAKAQMAISAAEQKHAR